MGRSSAAVTGGSERIVRWCLGPHAAFFALRFPLHPHVGVGPDCGAGRDARGTTASANDEDEVLQYMRNR